MEDLDGYWDACVAPQIAELETRFERCDDLRANAWVVERSGEPAAPKKRVVRKATRKTKSTAGARPSTRAFLATMRQKKRDNGTGNGTAATGSPAVVVLAPKRPAMDTDDDTDRSKRVGLPGMTVSAGNQLLTPVRASKREQDSLGARVYVTPVRRSARNVSTRGGGGVVEC